METEEDVIKLRDEKLEELIGAEGTHKIYTLQVEIKILDKILGD